MSNITTKQIDKVQPTEAWQFDAEVTSVFDDMLARSIPQYEVMREACVNIGSKFIVPHTDVVDLGCSRGEAMASLIEQYGNTNNFIGVEVSDAMLQACRERFARLIDKGRVNIQRLDLRTDYPKVNASLTMCVLTLQFTPIEYRLQIMQNIYDHIETGGALLLVEKVIGASAPIDKMMVDIYYDLKRYNGYSNDQINRKRLSLEGVLVPVTANWNMEMLRSVGFKQIDCFWRWMNFAGWVAIK